jgi:hypothetical protein
VELRTLQRAVAPHRQARRAAEVATIRFETAPGHQLQIDFGERRVLVGGREMRVYFFVAVLGYSRRIFVRAFLPGVDLAGYAGFADEVDNHWWRIITGVALGTLVSATAQRSQPPALTAEGGLLPRPFCKLPAGRCTP